MRQTSVAADEARIQLSDLLDRVERGECITITRSGIPVAVLVPEPARRRAMIADTIAELQELRREVRTLDPAAFAELIAEARR